MKKGSKHRKGITFYRVPKPDAYEVVDSVPEGIRWKPAQSCKLTRHAPPPSASSRVNRRRRYETKVRMRDNPPKLVYLSIGNVYKIVRIIATGAVTYYRLKNFPAARPAEVIDAEPKRMKDNLRVGRACWFVDTGARWYLCKVIARDGQRRITITSVTGIDADRTSPWPYGELEFPIGQGNPLFRRLRPLRARYQ